MAKTIEEINSFTTGFIHRCFKHPDRGDWDLPLEDMVQISTLLSIILDAIIERSGNKSKWEKTCGYECEGRPSAMVDSFMKKTGARCRLTLHEGYVSLSISLPHPEELPSMNNTFWTLLSTSITYNELTYFSTGNLEIISKNETSKKLSKFVKAPLFNLITEFTVAYLDDPESQRIGDFEKSIFFLNNEWENVIDFLYPFLGDFTKISQALYRSYYIKASKDPAKSLGLANLEKVRPIFSWIINRTGPWTRKDIKSAFPNSTSLDIRAALHLAKERGVIPEQDSK